MKVTALIPDALVKDVKQYAGGKNLTECLIVALEEWTSLKKIKSLNNTVNNEPFEFADDFTADSVRSKNRNR